MLNILICAYCVDKNDISEAQMAYEWICRLSQHANLWVITAGSRLHETCGLEGLPNIHLIPIKQRFSFKWTGFFDRAVHPGYVEFYIKAKKAVQEILSSHEIDLCHHLSPQSIRMPSPFHALGYPYIIGPIHGGMQPPEVMKELQGKEDTFFILRKFDRFRAKYDPVLKKSFKNAKVTVISTPDLRDRSPVNLCHRHEVIPGTAVCYPTAFQSHENISDPVRFIYAGKLVPSKGLELLIEAFSECKSRNVLLSIYGCGGSELFYKELVKTRKIESQIHWGGFIEQKDLYQNYSESDVFIFPSLKEPMGTVVLEAMGAGLPVICVDGGGPGYMVTEQTGVKIPLSNKSEMVKDLAQAVDLMVENPSLRKEMGFNARMRVQKEFTWDVVVQKMVTIYHNLIW